MWHFSPGNITQGGVHFLILARFLFGPFSQWEPVQVSQHTKHILERVALWKTFNYYTVLIYKTRLKGFLCGNAYHNQHKMFLSFDVTSDQKYNNHSALILYN